MVPQSFAQAAKSQFLVSQGLQNQQPQGDGLNPDSWKLETNLRDTFRPLPPSQKNVPPKQHTSNEVFVEIIYCGESNAIYTAIAILEKTPEVGLY
jgi:hypothetical protein